MIRYSENIWIIITVSGRNDAVSIPWHAGIVPALTHSTQSFCSAAMWSYEYMILQCSYVQLCVYNPAVQLCAAMCIWSCSAAMCSYVYIILQCSYVQLGVYHPAVLLCVYHPAVLLCAAMCCMCSAAMCISSCSAAMCISSCSAAKCSYVQLCVYHPAVLLCAAMWSYLYIILQCCYVYIILQCSYVYSSNNYYISVRWHKVTFFTQFCNVAYAFFAVCKTSNKAINNDAN